MRRNKCERKVRHDSLDAAYAAVRNTGKGKAERLVGYHCKFCGGYHVGHSHKQGRSVQIYER